MKKKSAILFTIILCACLTSCNKSQVTQQTQISNDISSSISQTLSETISQSEENISDETSNEENHIVMFTGKRINYGEYSINDDEWLNDVWTVYYDGTVEVYSEYQINGKTDLVTYKLSDDSFTEFTDLIEKDFESCTKGTDASDGCGWKMTSYSKDNTIIHEFDGYIYNIGTLENIERVLYESLQQNN